MNVVGVGEEADVLRLVRGGAAVGFREHASRLVRLDLGGGGGGSMVGEGRAKMEEGGER